MFDLTPKQEERLTYWLPALMAGAVMGAVFIWLGNTPLLRAGALALVVTGVSLTLRRMGAGLSIIGGMALGFSPAFWSQTGGTLTTNPQLVIGLLGAAGVVMAGLYLWRKRLFASVAAGTAIFVGLYLIFGITERSLRLTTLLAAWMLYMLVIALRQTNPRPEDPPATTLSMRHKLGVLLLFVLGVLNDPLFVLFAPAVVLGLWLSHVELAAWYWITVAVTTLIGVWGTANQYLTAEWMVLSMDTLPASAIPVIVPGAWRNPERWLHLITLIVNQFTWIGVLLGIIGIARMSRWYPTLGVVLMVAYGTYSLFGLAYFGGDADVLLLPLLIIQVICITYAVHTIGQWISRERSTRLSQIVVTAAFVFLPLTLLLRILESGL